MSALASLEDAFLAATPDDQPDAAQIIAALPDPAPASLAPGDLASADDLEQSAPSELMSVEDFTDQFIFFHYMGQSLIEAKIGEDTCPIGKQAESQGGRKAAQSAYRVLARNEFIARIFLSQGEGIMTDLLAVGMHCFACRQIVNSALSKST